jgi:nucleoside-diphosphate-sugar epimerase
MSSKNGKVEVWGTGQEARDLLYVDDLMEAVELCIESQGSQFEIFNVGSGVATEIRSLVEAIIEESGKPLEICYNVDKPSIPTRLCVDYSKITAQLGWLPRHTLREGLRKTLRWYKLQKANAAQLIANH